MTHIKGAISVSTVITLHFKCNDICNRGDWFLPKRFLIVFLCAYVACMKFASVSTTSEKSNILFYFVKLCSKDWHIQTYL